MRTGWAIGLLALLAGCTEDEPTKRVDEKSPTARISVPVEGEEVANGALFVARGQAIDEDTSPENLLVTWFVGDEERCPPQEPDSDGATRCDVSFSWDKQSISMRVEDNDGNSHTDEVNISLVEASGPVVNITAPVDNASFREDELISFEAHISDAEDTAEGLAIYWESDNDGLLDLSHTISGDGTVTGSGYLTPSTHVIRLWAEDTSGWRSSDEVTVQVYPEAAPPVIEIDSPENGDVFAAGSLILFQARVNDEKARPDEIAIEWSSSSDGILNTDGASSSGDIEFSTASLSLGEHAISVEATDPDDMNDVDTIIISVVDEEAADTGE